MHIISMCSILVCLAVVLIRPAAATIINVPADHATIQGAINAAINGDEVIVQPGFYSENVVMLGKNITLRSSDPTSATVVATTIIDGGTTTSVITFAGSETSACAVLGFTIQNGNAASGGGIRGNGCAATISRNVIQNNTASSGAGIYGIEGLISRNIITNNVASTSGGGIAQATGATIEFNTISYNQVTGGARQGAGIRSSHDIICRNNRIVYNQVTTGYGAGVGIDNSSGFFANNVIAFNETLVNGTGAAMFAVTGTMQNCVIYGNESDTAAAVNSYRLQIVNCIIWGNVSLFGGDYDYEGALFNCAVDSWPGVGEGLVTSDPMFADAPNGDFTLLMGSPCINAGDENYIINSITQQDILGNCRVTSGTQVDIGAHEFGAGPDADGDLLADANEAGAGGNPLLADTDGDTLIDGLEVRRWRSAGAAEALPGLNVPADVLKVQRAIFLCAPNEPITLQPGTYQENINSMGKSPYITGTDPNDWSVIEATMLDGQGRFSVAHLSDFELPASLIRGVTFYNGGGVDWGGGIQGANGPTTIEKCLITSNTALLYGGGISDLTDFSSVGGLIDSIIEFNTAGSWGGGIDTARGARNIIRLNTAGTRGGGVNGGLLYGCEIYDNSAPEGGGLYQSDITNCVVYGNTATVNGGGGFNMDKMRNSIVRGNSAPLGAQLGGTFNIPPTYNCIQDWPGGGTGNFTSDPLFVNAAVRDFHIQIGSPCVDAGGTVSIPGVYNIDSDGDARAQNLPGAAGGDGSNYDVGVDELPASLAVGDWHMLN